MKQEDEPPTICVFRRFFGIECVGCGLTRACSAFLHGEPVKALALNKLALVVGPVLVGGGDVRGK